MNKKRLASFALAAIISTGTINALPYNVLSRSAISYAIDGEGESTSTAGTIHVHKMMYPNVTQNGGKHPSFENNGEVITSFPENVVPYNVEKYGPVEYTLYDMTDVIKSQNNGKLDLSQKTFETIRKAFLNGEWGTGYTKPNHYTNASDDPKVLEAYRNAPGIQKVNIGKNGTADFTNVPFDGEHVYAIVETKAPTNGKPGPVNTISAPIVFATPFTSPDGTKNMTELNFYPKNEVNNLKIFLMKLGQKTGENKKESISGVHFDLYKGEPGKGTKINTHDLVTNENGVIEITDVVVGKYYLVEKTSDHVTDTANAKDPTKDFLIGYEARNDEHNKLIFEIKEDGSTINPQGLKNVGLTVSYENFAPPTGDKKLENEEKDKKEKPDFDATLPIVFKSDIKVPLNIKHTAPHPNVELNDGQTFIQKPNKDYVSYGVFNYTDTPDNLLLYPKGGELPTDLTVKLGDKTFVEGKDYVLSKFGDHGFKVDFIMSDGEVSDDFAEAAGQNVTISYSMLISPDAVPENAINNHFDLNWYNGPKPNEELIRKTSGDKKVYTFGAKFLKESSGAFGTGIAKEPLKGAEFIVQNAKGEYYVGTKLDTDGKTYLPVFKAIEGDLNNAEQKANIINEIKKINDKAILTSKDDGTFEIKGLESGNYNLIEIKAPQGYRLNMDKITFSVGEDTYSNVEKTVKVQNDKNPDMPLTGSERVILIAGTGGALLTVGYFVLRAQRKKEYVK